MTKYFAIGGTVLLAALLAGTYAFTRLPSQTVCSGTAIAGGAIGGPFELVAPDEQVVTDADVITEPSIIYFGYSFCPDVCPIDNARNAAAVDVLADLGHSVTPIFITVDPERDTPEVMGDYVENFHPKLIGLSGSEAQIKNAAQAYRVVYSKEEDGDPDYYLVSHSVFSYFVTPQDGFVEFFRREDSPEQMAERIACHLDV